MNIIETKLPGVILIEPEVFTDSRGFFFECFHTKRYAEYGLPAHFAQDNYSRSTKNVLRGLHYQLTNAQGKLIWVTRGKVFDVVIDVRLGSPTFGQWLSIILSEDKPQQLYIPPGLAHGFCTLADEVNFHYKCTNHYYPHSEQGIRWNDPDFNIPWPVSNPILSDKDQLNPNFSSIPKDKLPCYQL